MSRSGRVRRSSQILDPPAPDPQTAQTATVLALSTQQLPAPIVAVLRGKGYRIYTPPDIDAGIASLAAETAADVVVLHSPSTAAAISICVQFKETALNAPIFVLVDDADVSERVKILDSGATFVLDGSYATAELLARLRALVRRGGLRPSPLTPDTQRATLPNTGGAPSPND